MSLDTTIFSSSIHGICSKHFIMSSWYATQSRTFASESTKFDCLNYWWQCVIIWNSLQSSTFSQLKLYNFSYFKPVKDLPLMSTNTADNPCLKTWSLTSSFFSSQSGKVDTNPPKLHNRLRSASGKPPTHKQIFFFS